MVSEDYNKISSENKATGLSTSSTQSGGRFFQKNGKPNIQFMGNSVLKRLSIYQYMLQLSTWKFVFFIALAYMLVNLFFAIIYFVVGAQHFGGIKEATAVGKFWESFFFSIQTLSTVGYGHVYPNSLTSNTIAAIESFTGILMLAIATGILYGRFSKPKAYLKYSSVALFSSFNDGYALMFRFAPYKQHFLTDVEVKVTCIMRYNSAHNERKNKFYNLDLELSKVNSLFSSWTIVHPVNEKSPFYKLSRKDIEHAETEILVFIKGYDEEYANAVVSRTSYTFEEFIYGAKFKVMFEPSKDKKSTNLHLDKIDDFFADNLPVNL